MAQEKVTALPLKTAPKAAQAPVQREPAAKAQAKSASKPAKKAAPKAVKKPAAAKKAAAPKKAVANKKTTLAKSVKTASVKAKKPAEKAVKKMAARVKNMAQAAAQTGVGTMYLSGNTNPTMETIMTQNKAQFDKLTKDAGEMNREHMEACIKSSTIFAKGCEDMMRTMLSLAQSSAERQGKFMKEALASKTLNEWTEVLNKNAQSTFDECMTSATKLTEMSVKILSDAADPINSQLTKGIQKASKSMAA